MADVEQNSDQFAAASELPEQEISLEKEDSDEDPLDLPKSAFTPINFASGARRVIDLYRAYKEDKELDPRPSFQRGYVWDRNKATKLVESILLHVPLPLVYTAEEDSGIEVVIDGQQRLTTCFSFIEGEFPLTKADEERKNRGEAVKRRQFKLGKMKILSHLKGQNYSDLSPELKKTFNNFQLQIIKISKESHPDVKFEIFERLNTGSVSLSDQEIRNCIYRGEFNDLLMELANYPLFQKMLGISSSATRMQDVELVLRFLAFNELTHLNYNNKMRGFLNGFMRERRAVSAETADKYKKEFYLAVENAFTVFGEHAFRRYTLGTTRNPDGKWERPVNKALYDAIMFWFARFEKREIVLNTDVLREMFIKLCTTDIEFMDSITLGTADGGRVRTRFKKWGEAIESCIDVNSTQMPRTFNFQTKNKMFQADATCHICKQQISNIDDAEVDHIVPFSSGGATSLENAGLSHRFCNRSKGDR